MTSLLAVACSTANWIGPTKSLGLSVTNNMPGSKVIYDTTRPVMKMPTYFESSTQVETLHVPEDLRLAGEGDMYGRTISLTYNEYYTKWWTEVSWGSSNTDYARLGAYKSIQPEGSDEFVSLYHKGENDEPMLEENVIAEYSFTDIAAGYSWGASSVNRSGHGYSGFVGAKFAYHHYALNVLGRGGTMANIETNYLDAGGEIGAGLVFWSTSPLYAFTSGFFGLDGRLHLSGDKDDEPIISYFGVRGGISVVFSESIDISLSYGIRRTISDHEDMIGVFMSTGLIYYFDYVK